MSFSRSRFVRVLLVAVMHHPPLPPGPGLSLPVAVGSLLRPPELLRPRLNRHLGRRIEPLAGEWRPPRPSQAPSRLGSRRSGPDAGHPEMLEFSLSQETARTARLILPVEGREENLLFHFVSVPPLVQGTAVPTLAKKERFPFPPFLRFMGRQCATPCFLTLAHYPFCQEQPIRYSSPRTSGQSRLRPREFGEDASELTAFCTIHPYSLSLHHHRYVDCAVGAACTASEAWLTLPSLSRWLTCTIRLGYAIQFARRPPKFNGVLETSVAVRNAPVLREGIAVLLANDAIKPVPPAEMRQGFYSPYFIVPKKGGGLRPILDLRVLNRALHKLPFKMRTRRRIIKCIPFPSRQHLPGAFL